MNKPKASWAIDASMSRDGLFCFVPYKEDENSRPIFVEGLNFLAPPERAPVGRIVCIYHPAGEEAVETWIEANREALQKLPW